MLSWGARSAERSELTAWNQKEDGEVKKRRKEERRGEDQEEKGNERRGNEREVKRCWRG